MTGRRMCELLIAPCDWIHLAPQLGRHRRKVLAERVPVHLADEEQIHVTPERVAPRRVRAEQKRELDAAHRPQPPAQDRCDAGRLPNQVLDRWQEWAALNDRPQAQVAQTAALDKAGAEQQLEGPLDRVRVRIDPPGDLARVQLLARRSEQQSKHF